jgi:geranylgeranyl pyrophosphate synthase
MAQPSRIWLAAAHLLQSSTIITDDILDAGSMHFGRPAFHQQYNVNYGPWPIQASLPGDE